REKACRGYMAETTHPLSIEARTETLSRIRDQKQILFLRDLPESIIVSRLTEQIDSDNAGRPQACGSPRRRRRRDARWVEVEIDLANIGKDRRRTDQTNRFGRGNECKCGNDDRVSRADLSRAQSHLESIRAVRTSDAMARTGEARELLLELMDL